MQWIELSAKVGPETLEQVSSMMGKYGQGGAVIEESGLGAACDKVYIVKIYLPHARAFKSLKCELETSLAPLHIQLGDRILKPEDWFASLKDHFHPLEIGEKLIIKPSWIKLPSTSNRIVIELDPGAAFGTGLHPTTRLCLLRLQQHLQSGMSVLDLGTGTGILAIAAAKLGSSFILALDFDPVAVKSAVNNAVNNGVDQIIKIRRGTLSLRSQREFKERFDIVLANITAGAISDLASGLFKVTKSGGVFIGTGIHSQQLDEVLIKLALAGFRLEAIDSEEEWRAVVARKPE
jgi:ribosomal protein L11 methyltransferase